MDEKQLKAMISSTSLDLPEHRKEVLEACQRQGVFAIRMEDLPAHDAAAYIASLKLVDKADIYIGVFAHRYGHIPKENNPDKISITEMEYNWAVERGIARMIFIMHEDHPIKIADVEQGESVDKLKAFLERITTGDNIVNFFISPAILRAEVINSIAQYKQKKADERPEEGKPVQSEFHYVSRIPEPPEIYIAHPYSLLQTGDLVGRQEQLNELTDWVAKPDSEIYKSHILNIVAIGGMGKSALTWKWFNDIAPEEMKPLAGRMWWSFYESDATFENFVIRALAYVSKRPIENIRQISSPERESELLTILNQEPFLFVLDGLERILIAYSKMDAARQKEDEADEQKNKRKTIDPRVGSFLKKLVQNKNSRILISTRLFPAELETEGGDPLPGVSLIDLKGLTENDAIGLWRAFNVSGSRDLLVPIFDSIDRHPLLIQALAGEVKRYKKAPGDFEKWRESKPKFDPASFPKVQDAMAHVIEYALKDLGEKQTKVLNFISAFRMPTGYDTLVAIVLASDGACGTEIELDSILVELEDRGLVGWDKRSNRYDLHPIVRGVVWSGLDGKGKEGVYTRLHDHFEAVPMIENYWEVNSLEDLTPAIELYHTLIGLERYDDAYNLFVERINKATLWRLSGSRQRIELLEMLFPDGLDQLPRLSRKGAQATALGALAQGYKFSGQPQRAVPLFQRNITIRSETKNDRDLCVSLSNLSNSLWESGSLFKAESNGNRALILGRKQGSFHDAMTLLSLGMELGARGVANKSVLALNRALRIFNTMSHDQMKGVSNAFLAQRALWFEEYDTALKFADHARELAHAMNYEKDFIRALRTHGKVALGLNDLIIADDALNHALTRARAGNLVEEELPALTALAELRRRQGDLKAAREFLNDVWEYAERGPYPPFHADALNVLAQIERDAGNTDKAIEAATKAYELAWCDGPPYAYHWGLIKAQKHLEELGAPLPKLEPFDESKFEPMPEVEIDPEDEFHVGKQGEVE